MNVSKPGQKVFEYNDCKKGYNGHDIKPHLVVRLQF